MATDDAARAYVKRFDEAHANKKLPYYALLDLPEDCSQQDIVRSFRSLALRHHPDKPGGDEKKFKEINRAYSVLKDPRLRRKYHEIGFDEGNVSWEETDGFVDAFFGEGARAADGRSADWRLNAISNYQVLDATHLPPYLVDIARIGLRYLASMDMEWRNIILLRHARVDILYVIVGLLEDDELTQESFDRDSSYSITYLDNPLQPGIAPRWSDQNQLGGGAMNRLHKKASVAASEGKSFDRKALNSEEYERRQKYAVAMLEYQVDELGVLEEDHRRQAQSKLAQNHMDMYQEDGGMDLFGQDDGNASPSVDVGASN